MKKRLIIAVDGLSAPEASKLIDKTKDHVFAFKLNEMLHDSADICKMVVDSGVELMADSKIHEIPIQAVGTILKLFHDKGASIITVHCVMELYPLAAYAPFLAGVTILTSSSTSRYFTWNETIPETVQNMTEDLVKRKYGYVVCSGQELPWIKELPIKKIIPAIRPKWASVPSDDQRRIVTPRKAIMSGADYLVVGRPITRAKSVSDALTKTLDEIEEAESELEISQ